ncbi:anion exchange protein 3 [Cocos nucifera]|uniref:Anion exchange protein 3 n=1 Tax=Cocos nucifera TaxID=13894 RepID=A0A8K0N0J0_COCNU|nr:anion exchange protein 3 [Cocos nucifera]
MSLVDYDASSSEEEEEIGEDDEEQEKKRAESGDPPSAPPPPPPPPQDESPRPSSSQHSNVASPLPPPSLEKLPDVSHLLASPLLPSNQMIGTDHSSRVAAAMAESASRKRESNGSAFPFPRSKLPRGQLPHSRNIPDTSGGQLIPPQLRGRSNVVTEDISKLFVNRHPESSH